jgi:glyoxylase-like metal-dependent hydrolase (beta-lactamase superfamily II)
MFAQAKRKCTAEWIRLARCVLAVLASVCLVVIVAHAAAPQAKTQAPGFYRIMLGDFEITALSDGVFDLKTRELLTNVRPAILDDLLARSFHGEVVPTSVNAYLVNTGGTLILVDTGAAKLFGPTLGNLVANLVASGYRPEQVDTILITHMHPDHVGGLVAAGKRVFPNATVYADQREADFWLNPAALKTAPADRKAFVQGAAASIGPYASAGRFKRFKAPQALFSGIRALAAPGHTPGHTIYEIESKGQKLLLWGDLVDIAAVQFAEPTVTIAFDSDAPVIIRERAKAYAAAAQGRYLVAGAHLPFPGFGHIRTARVGYEWLPIDYDTMP